MRSGKTHFALLKIEGRKEKRKKKANCERRAGPTHLTCGVRERNIYRPKSLPGFLTLIPFLSLSTSFIIPAVLSCSVCQHSLSLSLLPMCHLFLSLLLLLCLSLLVLLSARLTSAAMGYFRLISLSCGRTWGFAVRVFAARTVDHQRLTEGLQ